MSREQSPAIRRCQLLVLRADLRFIKLMIRLERSGDPVYITPHGIAWHHPLYVSAEARRFLKAWRERMQSFQPSPQERRRILDLN